ncbi:MAG: hypothetical protein FJX59_12185, partial [Alphaproteobacteria bacterium]|nr:hypothetical protein [Alphaproteobacteria bacterium]
TPTAAWNHLPVFAVGPATAEAAREAGYEAVHDGGGDARTLAARLEAAFFRRAVYPSTAEPAADLETQFPGRVVRVPVYRMTMRDVVPDELAETIRASRVTLAPIFSRRTGQAFSAAARKSGLGNAIVAVGISRAAMSVDAPGWSSAVVAERPNQSAVVAALRSTWSALQKA